MAANKQRTRRRAVTWLALLAISLLGLAATIRAHTRTKLIPASQIASVEKGDVAKSVVASGKVQPVTKVELKSKASGIVTKLFVDANAEVHRGQILAQLDQQEISDQVAAQQAQLTAAESNARAALASISYDEVNAQAPDLPMYQSTFERAQHMASEGVLSKQSLEDAQQKYLAAANIRDKAVAQIGVDKARYRQAQAQVVQAQASLRQLQEQLAYTTITSPIDGVILSRDVETGDAVSSILVLGSTATPIMTIGDVGQVYVQGKVDESDIGHVFLGQPARIRVESFKDQSFSGRVTRIAPLGVDKDNVTTFEVRVSIDNAKGILKANMTANAEILLDEHKGVLTVPEQSVSYDKDRQASVSLIDPAQKEGFRTVKITPGLSNGTRTEVLAGLKEGDKVMLPQ